MLRANSRSNLSLAFLSLIPMQSCHWSFNLAAFAKLSVLVFAALLPLRPGNWNSLAIFNTFLQGLANYIKDELLSHDIQSMLDRLIRLAIRVDLHFQGRRQVKRQYLVGRQPPSRPRRFTTAGSSPITARLLSGAPKPMQLGRTSLT